MRLAGGRSRAKVRPRSPRSTHAPSGMAGRSATLVPLMATTGPRSDGTSRSSAPGSSLAIMERNSPSRAAGMSTRNKAGRAAWDGLADLGQQAGAARGQHDEQRQAEAERHRQADRCRPGPVERRDAEADDRPAAMPQAARGHAQQKPKAGEQQHQPGNGADSGRGEGGVAGAGDGQSGGGCKRQRRDEPAPPCAIEVADVAAQQLCRPGVDRRGNRAPARRQGHQQAEQAGLGQGRPLRRGIGRNGQRRTGNRAGQSRDHRADAQPDREGRGDDDQHLDDEHAGERAAACAKQLEDGDGRSAGGGEGLGRAGDSNPAGGQCRQGDQQQHLTHAFDETPCAAAGFAPIEGVPAAFGKALAESLGRDARIGAFGQQQAVGTGVDAARLDQSGRGEAGLVDERRRGQREAGHGRHGRDDAGDAERAVADADIIPDPHRQPLGKVGAQSDFAARWTLSCVELQSAGERPAGVDAAQLRELGPAARGDNGRTRGRCLRDRAQGFQGGAFRRDWPPAGRRRAPGRRRAIRGRGRQWPGRSPSRG